MERRLELPSDYQGLTTSDWFSLRPVLESSEFSPNYPKHHELYDKLCILVKKSLKGHDTPISAAQVAHAISKGALWRELRETGCMLEPVELQAMQIADKVIYKLSNAYWDDALQQYNAALLMHRGKLHSANDSADLDQRETNPVTRKLAAAMHDYKIGAAFRDLTGHYQEGGRYIRRTWEYEETNFNQYNQLFDWISMAQKGQWPKPPKKRVSVVRSVLKALKLDGMLPPERPLTPHQTKDAGVPQAANDPN